MGECKSTEILDGTGKAWLALFKALKCDRGQLTIPYGSVTSPGLECFLAFWLYIKITCKLTAMSSQLKNNTI